LKTINPILAWLMLFDHIIRGALIVHLFSM